MPRAFEGIVNRARRAEQRYAVRQIIIGHAPPLHRIFPEFAVLIRSARIGKNDRQGDFSVAKIIAHALAHCCRIGRIIDGIVD